MEHTERAETNRPLFQQVFGFSELRKNEVLDISADGRINRISLNLFRNYSPEERKLQMNQRNETVQVLSTLRFMLTDKSVEKQDKSTKKKAGQIYKNFIEKHGLDPETKKELAEEIEKFIASELYSKATKRFAMMHEVAQARNDQELRKVLEENECTKENCEIKLLKSIRGQEDTDGMGGDIARYIANGRFSLLDGNGTDLLVERRDPRTQEKEEKTAEDFTNCLDIFLEQLGHREKGEPPTFDKAATEIKDRWATIYNENKQKGEELQQKIQIFFNELNHGELGEDGKMLSKLFLAFNQNVHIGVAKAFLVLRDSMPSDAEKVKGCRSSESTAIQFTGGTIKMTNSVHYINVDHPFEEEQRAQQETLQSYRTDCRYKITLAHEMTADLSDLNDWKVRIGVAVGTPQGEEDTRTKTFLKSLNQFFKLGGYSPVPYTCEKQVWI